MSSKTDISVIICTYNRSELLKNTLEDIVNSDVADDLSYEVLVIDNNSNDNTQQICEDFIGRFPDKIRYCFEGRQGKTFALNTGIKIANGTILAFTDDDVEIDNKWLASIKAAFDAHPSCRAFGGRVIPLWPNEMPSWIIREGPYKNTGGALVDHDKGDRTRSYYEAGMHVPCGANMFFARGTFLRYGYFKESLNLRVKNIPMCEDTEFCFRIVRNKEEMLYIPNAVVYHPVYSGRLTKKYFRKSAFKSGRASALMNDDSGKCRRLFNVPGYIYRIIINKMLRYILSAFTMDQKRKIYYELGLIYYAGIFYEYYLKKNTI